MRPAGHLPAALTLSQASAVVTVEAPWFLTLWLAARAQPELPSQVPYMVLMMSWVGGLGSMEPQQCSVEYLLYASLVQTLGK